MPTVTAISPASADDPVRRWLDERAEAVLKLKPKCSIGDDRVCLGPQEDGGACSLCARKAQRDRLKAAARA